MISQTGDFHQPRKLRFWNHSGGTPHNDNIFRLKSSYINQPAIQSGCANIHIAVYCFALPADLSPIAFQSIAPLMTIAPFCRSNPLAGFGRKPSAALQA
jgi:hypothetical protein